MEFPSDLAILLLGLYLKDPARPVQKNLCTPMFIAALFIITKCLKHSRCLPVNDWIKKLEYIFTMEYYAAERKKELLSFPSVWMELKSIMVNEISQVVKYIYCMFSPISGT